jgi:hypothetical protein
MNLQEQLKHAEEQLREAMIELQCSDEEPLEYEE